MFVKFKPINPKIKPAMNLLQKEVWTTAEKIKFSVDNFNFEIPAGYLTDLASVPRIFWSITPPFGADTVAFVIHDYLYGLKKSPLSRKQIDKVLKQVQSDILIYGFNAKTLWQKWLKFIYLIRINLMYYAVRAFGWLYRHK